MSIENIYNLYDEYQSICSLLIQDQKHYDLIETEKFIEIKQTTDIDITFLTKLQSTVESFEIYCNPFSADFSDIIEDIERGSILESEIESIVVSFDKKSLTESLLNIDFIFLDSPSAIRAIQEIHPEQGTHKINIGIPNNENVETDLFNFINLVEGTTFEDVLKKEIDSNTSEHIEFYLSNNRNNNHNHYYNPYSFVMKGTNNSKFNKLLQEEFYNIMLECLSDKKEANQYIIRGEKSVKISINENFSTVNYTKFLDIFSFLISHQKYTEKFIISKKVFSLYINDNETISDLDNKLPAIWKTINHYYDHYVEDNIKEFFKTKDQLLKEAMNVSKVIYEQTDKISTSIIASILSLLVLIVTTLYRSLDKITIPYASSILVIFFTFSLLYYYLMHDSSKKRYELTKKQFEYFIAEVSLIQNNELLALQDTYLVKPFEELKSTLLKFLLIIGSINLFLLIAFLVFICAKYNYCLC
ncbi:hypothetical protein [Bacillus wiedmannii]|uniref:hypothetical protein n=1 Tax=Bacillus wiedmannii TaxID=1890302 RepID=UPI000BF7EB57|nr:hypothetical protein [Bacillus wiedmannii]PGD91924.1 hypothetical protein COM48_22635 [Bacillus wiedmannii]